MATRVDAAFATAAALAASAIVFAAGRTARRRGYRRAVISGDIVAFEVIATFDRPGDQLILNVDLPGPPARVTSNQMRDAIGRILNEDERRRIRFVSVMQLYGGETVGFCKPPVNGKFYFASKRVVASPPRTRTTRPVAET